LKILFCGYHNPCFLSVTEYAEKAITALGHALSVYDDRQFLFPGRVRDKVSFLRYMDLRRLNGRLVALARKFKPDICIVSGGHRILPGSIDEIRKAGTTAVLWTNDAPRDFGTILEAVAHYDFVFASGTEAIELLRRTAKSLRWLPFACDLNHHHPVEIGEEESKKYGSDIAFVGSFYPNRAKILEEIADFDIGVWGPGWNNLSFESPLMRRVKRPGALTPDEWIKIFCSSKIVIAAHYQDGRIPCYQASPRVYETLACKRFLLVDDQRDVKALFEDGKHLSVFKDTADLRKKLRYYLARAEERARIAENGFNEVTQKHTYLCRVKEMLDILMSGRACGYHRSQR